MHLGRNRTVEHRLEISPHGSERGAEIVGDVCHETFLVVLALCHLACHVGEGGGEVADLVLAVDLKLISEITDGVLLCRVRDLAERQIYHLCEKEQDDQRQQKEDYQRDVGYIQQRVAGGLQTIDRCMDDHIAFYLVLGGDRRKSGDHL